MGDASLDKAMEYTRQYYKNPELTAENERLARYVPEVVVGYITMRQGIFREPPEGALSLKDKELLCIAAELVARKTNPTPIGHTIKAIEAGATVQEVAEVVGIAIQLGGMITYRESGRFVLKAAEERAKELAAQTG